MVRQLGRSLARWSPWLIGGIALLITGWGFSAQAAISAELGEAMTGVHTNVKEARRLTGNTAAALTPLTATADTLEGMNRRLTSTAADVAAMNLSLGHVTTDQEAILTRIGSLNSSTERLAAALAEADTKNRSLLDLTADLTRQTEGQGASMEQLWSLTGEAIDHLAAVNRRLSFLRQF